MSLSTRYQIPDTNTRSHKFAPFYLSSEPLPLSLLPPLSLQWYGAESDILLKSTCSLDDLQALKEEIKPMSLHELPVIIQSTKGLEAVSWFRIGESRFQLQSNPVNVSRIPHCILVKSRIPNPGEFRVLDFLSTATSRQIPNHDTIKKRCNINKQHQDRGSWEKVQDFC